MNMRKNILVCFWICGLAVMAVACGRSQKPVAVKDEKLAHVPQVNEVTVITLERKDFARQLLSNGKLVAARKCALQFGTTGAIGAINVRNGEYVSAGTVIATLDRPDLMLLRESASLSLRKAELDLYDFLVGQGYTAGDTVSVPADLLATAKMKSGYSVAANTLKRSSCEVAGTVLKAPFSGRVADISQKPFDQTSSGAFCTIVDDSVMEVDFSVMESEYSFLAVGLPVRVRSFADETKEYSGKIVSVNPLVDAQGQICVTARLRNDGSLIDGMNVRVIVERIVPNQLVVPRSAVVIRDNLDVLFTCTEDGKAHWTYVTVLYSNGESFVVEANRDRNARLDAGDQVIVTGNLNLADNSDVLVKR